MKVNFFCKVQNIEVLQRNEFYAVDLKILRELGHEVSVSITPWNIPSADVYVVWWWTWAFAPLLRAKLAGRPVVVLGTFDHVLNRNQLENFPNRPWWHRQLIRLVLKHADANLVVSRDQEEFLQSHFKVNGLGYSPHVIDTDLYRPGPPRQEKFLLTFCWMNAGNSARKCIPQAIRAMARIHDKFPEHRLMICGEKGSDYPALKSLVHDLGAETYIEFLGVVTREQKIDLMQRCALYLQPTRAEGFGVAILEAMSCGATVLTSPVGAVPEVGGAAVEMVNGVDEIALASAAASLLGSPQRSAALGFAARARAVKEFSYSRRKLDLERVLSQVSCRPARQAA